MIEQQAFIPGLEPPTGWLYERLIEGYDIQSGDINGRYKYWQEEFSREHPGKCKRTIRNIKPLWQK